MALETAPPAETPDIVLLVEARDAAASGRATRLRLTAGLSQAELAAAIGVSAATVSRWESGDRRPHGATAVAYARLLRQLAERLVAA
jgi:transcriptional regulator with XRE-family HTH domain